MTYIDIKKKKGSKCIYSKIEEKNESIQSVREEKKRTEAGDFGISTSNVFVSVCKLRQKAKLSFSSS